MIHTDTTAADAAADQRRIDRFIAAYIAGTAVFALVVVGLVAKIEFAWGAQQVNWWLFATLAILLVVTESRSQTWIRFGDDGVVTASWTFAFSLMLIGSPFGAIVVMAFATVLAETLDAKPMRKVVFNTAQISLALGLGALVLFAFDIHGPVFVAGQTTTVTGVAVILSGAVVFGMNGLVLCKLLAVLDGSTFVATMRDSFALSMSADAAMLAIAPILVITTQSTLLMLPLIGVATFFVFQTARHAIEKAHQADHDPLTQLLNRRAFSARVDSFVQTGGQQTRHGGIFILDLDRFKEVNDRLGHRTGDQVLQAFANRLVDALPAEATVARLGGDEFAVLLEDLTVSQVDTIVDRLHRDLEVPLLVDRFPISAGSSIGVSFFPQHGESPSELMHAADVAMYRAKRYRSGVERYESLGNSQQKGRVSLLGDLANAIDQREFLLSYQPQIDVASGRTICVEALLRWNHSRLGLIAPGEYIALAEQTDLIGPLTDFVIGQALTDAARLPDTVRVAVNVSARNLQDRHFADRVFAALAHHQVPAHRLELEITESAIAIEPEQTATAIDALRAAGVRVAIDDFGTGYSSFGTLREITVDSLKIDRSFVTNALASRRDRQIVRALVDLGHSLDLSVVAEGVESTAVLEFLADAGCDIAQGYLIARPALIDDVVVNGTAIAEHRDRALS